MNKKQFLELIWDELIKHTDPENLPEKELDIARIKWDLTIGYGPTSKMLKKHIEKYLRKAAEDWLIDMGNAFDERSTETKTQKEFTLPDQERH